MFVRWSTRGVRPRSALAKAAVLRTVSFSFVLTSLCACGVGSVGMIPPRWSTQGVRPLWALAKTPCSDGAARSFFLCLRSCKHGARLGCLSGGARGACAPYGHSQKRLAPMALLDLFSYACARASTARGWDVCPVEHAERAPPFGTRKSSRATHCLFFAHASLRFMRRGMGRGSRRWSTRSVRPRSALAKTPCADGAARSFFLCLRSCKHGAGIRKTPALLRSEAFLLVGAGGRTRTDTDFTPQDFESSASASFTTPAQITIYHSTGELTSVLRSSARERSLCTFHGD